MLKKLRLVLKIIGCLFLGLFFLVALLILFSDNPPQEEKCVSITEKSLSVAVNSIKEGLPVATAEARKLEKNAVLTRLSVHLEGTEDVKARKGEIFYHYQAVDWLSFDIVFCKVVLDMKKQAITGIYTITESKSLKGWGISYVPEEFNSYLDIDEMLDVLESHKRFTYPDNPVVIIFIDREISKIIIESETGEREIFRINNSTKQLVDLDYVPLKDF